MEETHVIDTLVEDGVLSVDGGTEISLSADVIERIESTVGEIAEATEDGPYDRLLIDVSNEVDRRTLVELGEQNPRHLAEYLALGATSESLTHQDRLRALPIIDALYEGPPRDEGAPEAFVPIRGDQVALYLGLHRFVVLYVWRDDCEPCDTMRDDLDHVLADPPGELSLFAVYGPDVPAATREEYNIVSAPDTLFIVDGTVDTRLTGPQHRVVIEREVETLRGYATEGR